MSSAPLCRSVAVEWLQLVAVAVLGLERQWLQLAAAVVRGLEIRWISSGRFSCLPGRLLLLCWIFGCLCVFVCSYCGLAGLSAFHCVGVSAHELPPKVRGSQLFFAERILNSAACMSSAPLCLSVSVEWLQLVAVAVLGLECQWLQLAAAVGLAWRSGGFPVGG